MTLLAAGTALILGGLSLFHVYWAAVGGATSSVIPEVNGVPVFRPRKLGTLAVALALGGAGWLVAQRGGLVPAIVPPSLAYWGTWLVAAAFAGRAIGDGRLVGFFKRVRDTRFARMDTWVYSPLCAAIGIASAAVGAAGS